MKWLRMRRWRLAAWLARRVFLDQRGTCRVCGAPPWEIHTRWCRRLLHLVAGPDPWFGLVNR